MKKSLIIYIVFLLFMPLCMSAQSYSELWRQYNEAINKDLPQSARQHLDVIMKKAVKEKRHGDYLKSLTEYVSVQELISPDSLVAHLRRLDKLAESERDTVCRAILNAVMYRVVEAYRGPNLNFLSDKEYRRRATEHPQVLAAVSAKGYSPFVKNGIDSDVFNGDLFSVICLETKAYDAMYAYYSQTGNRRAACISALLRLKNYNDGTRKSLSMSETLSKYDSICAAYSDVDVVAEVAIERCLYLCSTGSKTTTAALITDIDSTLAKYSKWKTAVRVVNKRKQLTQPTINCIIDTVTVLPMRPIPMRFERIRNMKQVTTRVYRLNVDGRTQLDADDKKDLAILMQNAKLVGEATVTRTYRDYKEYELHNDTTQIPALPIGVYLVEHTTSPTTVTQKTLLYVSNVTCIAQELPGKKIRYVVVDATTSQPLPFAKLDLLTNRGNGKKSVWTTKTCDKDGELLFDYGKNASTPREEKPAMAYPYTKTDRAAKASNVYTQYYFYNRVRNDIYYHLFTDRSIYRPGQTVRLSLVAKRGEKNATAAAGEKITLSLRNPNGTVITEKEVVTDNFGGAAADFILPSNTLTGYFRITANSGWAHSFRVEEYKRPTFRVDIPTVKETYKGGDTLRLRGSAETFVGIGVKGANVSYSVTRKPMVWWRYIIFGDEEYQDTEIYNATTTTDDDGTFEIVMPLTLPKNDNDRGMYFNYVVEADVTDMAGESHKGEMTVPLGTRNAHLSSDIADKKLASEMKSIRFTLRNGAGKEVESTVKFRLDNEKKWREASTAEPFTLTKLLASGRHSIEAIAEGDTLKQQFVVFRLDDERPCVPSDEWFYTSARSFPINATPVTVQVGTSDKDVCVVYSMVSGDNVLESGTFRLSDENFNRKITYRPEYGDGITLTYAWIKDGRLHTYNTSIEAPKKDRTLNMKWTTFRNRLTPGEQEEWRLSVSHPDGTPAEARLIATLYDKSLDMIYKKDWNLSTGYTPSIPSLSWGRLGTGTHYTQGFVHQNLAKEKMLEYAHFYELPFSYFLYVGYQPADELALGSVPITNKNRLRGTNAMASTVYAVAETYELKGSISGLQLKESVASENPIQKTTSTQQTEDAPVQVRENFNETAFFAPSIITDERGEAVLRFTLPESVTTWHFVGLAHTKDICVGMLEDEAVAKKDVMVMPNIPRFLRMGDDATITTRIVNTSDHDISGAVKIELLDPETDAVLHSETQDFAVEKDRTSSATFVYRPDENHTLLVCRITASGASFSDGEQHYLPVLPEMELITKTVPLTMHSAGSQTVTLGSLFPTTDQRNMLTVEYMEDPSWLMIQALPTVGTPREMNAIEQCAAYYANTIAAHLLAEKPQMKSVFELWKREANDEKTLESSLSKNQTLKDIIIDETPWADDARWETEQKQRLADFFDHTMIDQRLQNTLEQLRLLQNNDGSWSWWEGMSGNYYVTLSVTELLTRLNNMTGYKSQTAAMLKKAYTYLDNKLVEIVKKMKADEKRGHKPSAVDMDELTVLYIAALRDTKAPTVTIGGTSNTYKQPAAAKEAIDYLLPILEKDVKNQSIYAKAMTAIVLNKNGRITKSREYVKSLKEYTVFSDEMGRYYDTRRAAYSWLSYKIPTQVMAMEALQAITPNDTLTIEEMRRWLLQEKRTQMWGNAINNANAINAFFNGASSARHSTIQTTIALDGQPLEMPKGTAAIGYVKTTVNNPQANTLTIEKTSQGTSWGAVYAQFMQKATDVEAQGGAITVKREILVKSQSADGDTENDLRPTTVSSLNVGSRIVVRITIDASRDLDFVQVSDRRAACMEPVKQLSGYRNGYYCSPKDNVTNYFIDKMRKGRYVIETEYFVDRAGTYTTGICTAGCAYAPEYRATTGGMTIVVNEK